MMNIWLVSIFLIVIFFGIGLVCILKYYEKQNQKKWFACGLYVLSFAALTFFSDLKPWLNYIHEQKNLQQAKEILEKPERLERLVRALELAVQKNSQDAKAWFLLGRVYAGRQEWIKAKNYLKKAYLLESNNTKYGLFYAESVWHQMGHLDNFSWKILNDILEREPEAVDVYFLKANDAMQRQCPKEAVAYWQVAQSYVKSLPEISIQLDKAIEKANKMDNQKCQLRF